MPQTPRRVRKWAEAIEKRAGTAATHQMCTFVDWNEPLSGSTEMDLVAHCGRVNRGSYVRRLALPDIASGWTEVAPIVVGEGAPRGRDRWRYLPELAFTLKALDADNSSEFVDNRLIEYCLGHGIKLTRSRPYCKNDHAWMGQKDGAVIRRVLGYRHFEGLASACAITRLCGDPGCS